VITLLIVLVLLFVVFRLMPGDPTRFFLAPGQTEQQKNQLIVEFGFRHWAPAPGNGYTQIFPTPNAGPYELRVNVTDSQSRTGVFYYDYVKRIPVPRGRSAAVFVEGPTGAAPWEIVPGDVVTLRAFTSVAGGPAGNETFAVNVTLTRAGTPVERWSDNNTSGWKNVTWTANATGSYSVVAEFDGNQTTHIDGYGGFAVNAPDPAPFRLAEGEWKLRADATSPQLSSARLTVNVTADGASVSRVTATVRYPNGTSDLVTLTHPQVAVPNNVLEEFWTYMTNMLVLKFGDSLYTKQPVWNEIATRVGPSILLFGSAVIISYVLGILLGAVLAWRRGSKMELTSIVVSLFFYSMPVFWFGLILLWAFAYINNWFPLGGFGGVDTEGNRLTGLAYAGDVLHHMALPLLNLVILSLAGHVLLMRNSMLEVMGEDYITTAKAKGLRERRVMYRHAARNALLPVVTAFALAISGVISGGVLTETIFSWPGMGAFLVTSTLAQDFPSVQGAFYLLALLTIFANLVADILYAYLDPRVRL
jgi:peptide/nickel transport system permease protein